MRSKHIRSITLALLVLCLVSLSCRTTPTTKPIVGITYPSVGVTLPPLQEIKIQSAITSKTAIDRVELYINGALTRTDRSPEGDPTAMIIEQPWIPTGEGSVLIGVLAVDTNGVVSEISQVTITISASSEVVQPPAGVTPTAEVLPVASDTPQPCTNMAEFLGDISIPYNSIMTPGWSFTKTWRVQNTGTCTWDGYAIIHLSGDLLSGISPTATPQVLPGTTVDINLNLVAPAFPGSFSATWRLRSSDGTVFGPDLVYLINIPQPDTPTPTSTSTHVPTFTPTVTQTNTPTKTPTTPGPVSSSMVANHSNLAGGTTGSVVASCPAGSVVTSGGFALSEGLWFYNSTKKDNGWQVYAKNNTTNSLQINVYALCLHNPGGTTTAILEQTHATPSTTTHLAASCPAGSVVVGGAFATASNGSLQLYNSSKSGNGWQIWVKNVTSGDPLFNVYAICLSGTSGTVSDPMTSVSVPANDYEHGITMCPACSYVTGGGFAINHGEYIYNTSPSGNGWQNYVDNPTSDPLQMYTYAICYNP